MLAASDGPVHAGVDAQLASTATIQGTVTNTGGAPLSGICVDANVPNGSGGWNGVGGTQTAADGTYTLAQLPLGDVRVHFRDCTGGPYIDQWYQGQSDFNSSTPITLTAGADQQNVDAQLTTGIQVSGTVTDGNGNPIPNVNVNVNPTGSGPSTGTQTDANGTTRPAAFRRGPTGCSSVRPARSGRASSGTTSPRGAPPTSSRSPLRTGRSTPVSMRSSRRRPRSRAP